MKRSCVICFTYDTRNILKFEKFVLFISLSDCLPLFHDCIVRKQLQQLNLNLYFVVSEYYFTTICLKKYRNMTLKKGDIYPPRELMLNNYS